MKYKLTDETKKWCGRTLHRIEALKDFELADGTEIHKGDMGGWIEKENNLSQSECCWVCDNALVCGNARVCDNALVYGNARVCGNARVYGNAEVYGDALVNNPTDVLTINPIGSRNDATTFYKGKDNKIYVKCGCKNTDIDTWLTMVDKTHGNNKHAQAYHLAADIARLQIVLQEETQ